VGDAAWKGGGSISTPTQASDKEERSTWNHELQHYNGRRLPGMGGGTNGRGRGFVATRLEMREERVRE